MTPCNCSQRQHPPPICCCSSPPKPHQCYCRSNFPTVSLKSCQNFMQDCPCSTNICRPRQPPLRTMQKALVEKWTELEKLGNLAQMYCCQQRALRHQLACLQARYCRLQRLAACNTEPEDQYSLMGCTRPTRFSESNQLQPYCQPENPSVYQGVLKIREKDGPNQGCTCNNPETTTTYRGLVRLHDQDNSGERACGPPMCASDCGLITKKLRTECEMKELSNQLTDINKSEVDIHERLQKLHEELSCLQTKIKSNWGQNALDRCTPAKENQTRFF